MNLLGCFYFSNLYNLYNSLCYSLFFIYLISLFIYMHNLTYLFYFWNYSLIYLGSVPPPHGAAAQHGPWPPHS